MYIDKKSPIPVYYQLKNVILDKIKSGEYGSGSTIPSERELTEKLGISRMTVRQALNQLVTEGVLYREKGKGTFVSKSKFEQRNIMSFSDIVRKRGLIPTTEILKFAKEDSDDSIMGKLELENIEHVYNIRRLRHASGTPVGIEHVFIPEKYCPGLENLDLTGSFYKLLKEKYMHSISYVDNVIEASKPYKEIREHLNITSNIPVLCISSTIFTESGLKLFYEKSFYRSDEYKYNVRVFRS